MFSIFSEENRLNLLPGKMTHIKNWKKQPQQQVSSEHPSHGFPCSIGPSWWPFFLTMKRKTVKDKEGFILT